MTHTEHVHLLFGIGLVLAGAFWLGAQAHPAPFLRHAWPFLLFLIGLFLVIPTETQERTYQPVGVWDTFLSVFPDRLAVWLESVRKPHVIQHKVAGLCTMVAGAIEWSRARGWLTASAWRWALPLLAVGAGLAIGVHGGTHRHLPRVGEQLHHWVLGAALLAGGAAYAAGTAPGARRPLLRAVLPVLLVLAGLEWALFYRVP